MKQTQERKGGESWASIYQAHKANKKNVASGNISMWNPEEKAL